MARRRNLLDVIQTRFECPVSWDEMAGSESRRFCGQCRKEVFDFAQMEPRAVRARIAASRGKLCARVTRENGRVKTLAPPLLPAPEPRSSERAPAIAATFFGAWLSLAIAAGASPSSDNPATAEAFLAADPQDDGPSPGHPASRPDLPVVVGDEMVVTADFASVEQVTMGDLVVVEPKLREMFDDSELVLAATVAESDVLEVNGELAEMRTVLRIERLFKGAVKGRLVTYQYSLPIEAFAPEVAGSIPELTPGSKVVAFLNRTPGEGGIPARPLYEAAGYSGGLRGYEAEEREAYVESLEELAGLHHQAGPRGKLDPAGLMEWLVATAENPLTRRETLEEIGSALADFEDLAQQDLEDPGEASDAARLGAAFTEAQKVRLVAALFASERLDDAGLELFRFVGDELDEAAARSWLIRALRRGEGARTDGTYWLLKEFAENLPKEKSGPFLDSAEERIEAVDELLPDDESAAAQNAREAKQQEVAKALFAELAALLENLGT